MSENPYVFVTGCTRSGTTLLQRMLDHHPQLAVSNDTRVIPDRARGIARDAEPPRTDDLVQYVVGYKYFDHLGIDTDTALGLAAPDGTFVEFIGALFDEFAQRQGKQLAGEKVPHYVRRMPMLHRLFPAARFIHIIRDGRDVALSTLDWVTPARFLGRLDLWRAEPVAVCALWWRRQVTAGQRGRERVGADRCLEVRYEALVDAPETTLRTIAAFLELPFDPAMLLYHRGRTTDPCALSSKDRWLPPTGGLRDWRVKFSPRDLELFEALAGDLLSSLGYPLATKTPVSEPVRIVAQRCRDWWEAEVESRSRRHVVPESPQ